MDKADHGKRLKVAMASRGVSNQALADAVGVGKKTVYNWRAGGTMPKESDLVKLRHLFGDYAAEGDAVEVALRSSDLVEWRQDAVLSFYKRNLHEQRTERGA